MPKLEQKDIKGFGNTLNGHTSMRLEPELWTALTKIVQREGARSREDVIQKFVDTYGHEGSRTAAVRAGIVDHFMNATEEAERRHQRGTRRDTTPSGTTNG